MSGVSASTLVGALEATLAEMAGLEVSRTLTVPFDASNPPSSLLPADRQIRLTVGGADVDRVIWRLPASTAAGLASRMYFGLRVTDPALIDAAVLELFCRVTGRALEVAPDLRIAAAPVIEPCPAHRDDSGAYGVAIRFESAAGPFTMTLGATATAA